MRKLCSQQTILPSIQALCLDYGYRCATRFCSKLFEMKHLTRHICLVVTVLSIKAAAQGPPIFTDTPIMLGLEGGGVRTFGNIVSKENAKAYVHILAIPYNISNKWQVGVIAPFVSKSPDGLKTNSGFGDLKIFTKHEIYKKDGKGKTFRGLLKITETFPTGNSKDLPPLGAGINQTTISLVNGYVTTKYGIYWEVGYNVTSGGLFDNVVYNIAFDYPLLPQVYPPKQLNVSLELNGNYVRDGVGNNLFISPAIQFIAGRKVLFETGVQLPLDEVAIEGTRTNYVLRIGTRILLF